jgi:hypothetical protein
MGDDILFHKKEDVEEEISRGNETEAAVYAAKQYNSRNKSQYAVSNSLLHLETIPACSK